MRKLLLIGLLFAGACQSRTSEVPVTVPTPVSVAEPAGPGAASPRLAVDGFLASVRSGDLQAMSGIWGDKNGPVRDSKIFSRQEMEQREIYLIRCFKHDSFRVLGESPAADGERPHPARRAAPRLAAHGARAADAHRRRHSTCGVVRAQRLRCAVAGPRTSIPRGHGARRGLDLPPGRPLAPAPSCIFSACSSLSSTTRRPRSVTGHYWSLPAVCPLAPTFQGRSEDPSADSSRHAAVCEKPGGPARRAD